MIAHSNPDHNQGIAPCSVDEGVDRNSQYGELAVLEGLDIISYRATKPVFSAETAVLYTYRDP
jgi:hypothetical protein